MSDWQVSSTIPSQFDANPESNDGSPPIGAPEGMSSNQYNNSQRYNKAAIRENYDDLKALEAFLGNMAGQDPDAVAITGGSVAGNGSGLTSLNASQLASGIVPADRLNGNYPDMSAGDSDKFGGLTPEIFLGLGEVKLWYGLKSVIDANPYWQVADGTNGTPDFQNVFIRGASNDSQVDGSLNGSGSATSSSAGDHDHGGNTGGHALTEAQNGPHDHYEGGISRDTTGGATDWKPPDDPTGLLRPGNYQGGNLAQFKTESSGAGQEHSHPISSSGDHNHSVDIDSNISHKRLWVVIRTA